MKMTFKVGDRVLRVVNDVDFIAACKMAVLDYDGPLTVSAVSISGSHIRLRGLGDKLWVASNFELHPSGPLRWSAYHAEQLRLAVVEADAELAKAVANYNRYIGTQPPQLEQIAYQPIGVKDASDNILNGEGRAATVEEARRHARK